MSDAFTLELPKGVPPQEMAALEAALLKTEGVEDAGTLDARSLDPATLGLWVQAATGVVGVVATALPLVERIVGLVRGRRIKGARLKIGNSEIDVDSVSAAELKAILDVARKSGG